MLIKKVLNSSVVIAVDDSEKECVLLGKGIGYGKKQGQFIEYSAVDQKFISVGNQKSIELLHLLESIPPEIFEVTQAIVLKAEELLQTKLNESVYFTLMDHLNFAIERFNKKMVFTNKVYWEIKNYYPKEFDVGNFAIQLMNEKFLIELPKEEASNIAFHIINAQSSNHTTNDGMNYAKMIGGIVNLIRYTENISTESIHYERFITHVKFFVERIYNGTMLDEEGDKLFNQIAVLYPNAMEISFKIKNYILQVYEFDITKEELSYLAVHINRLISYNEIK